MEVNAGRFYCCPLRRDSRVDDTPVATQLLIELAPGSVAEFLQDSTTEWENDTTYRFVTVEQTNVEILALATVEVVDADHISITVRPAGNPARMLPSDDQVLARVTVANGVRAAEKALCRWAEGFLGKKVN